MLRNRLPRGKPVGEALLTFRRKLLKFHSIYPLPMTLLVIQNVY